MKEVFKYIVAKHFFKEFAPNVKSWNKKLSGKNSNGNPVDFTEADKAEIRKGLKVMLNQIDKIDSMQLVSYKYAVEQKLWGKYNVNQVQDFNKKNKEMIAIIKKIEKDYTKKPTQKDYEQFFYAVSKLEWL